jgi:hypothetical protein
LWLIDFSNPKRLRKWLKTPRLCSNKGFRNSTIFVMARRFDSGGSMRAIIGTVVMAFTSSTFVVDPQADGVRELLKSDNYAVSWETARDFDPAAQLEIGDGVGHSPFTLRWMRFKPESGGVSILSIQMNEKPFTSKWPTDDVAVMIKSSRISQARYAALLHDLAIIDAARLRAVREDSGISSANIWLHARLSANKKMVVELDWAGYLHGHTEMVRAKPQAAVAAARAAIESLDFKEHTLTPEERAWASAKFTRDWEKYKILETHWWVVFRAITMIAVVGDTSALPALRDILQGDSSDHAFYLAINAVTRLTKKDVRDRPVEEMDVGKTRSP